MAHRDISLCCRIWLLSGHSGHGWTCCWLDPVANDPKQPQKGKDRLSGGSAKAKLSVVLV
jgi:hypothetical protein